MTALRIVPCAACGSEGSVRHITHISREDGQWDGHIEPCPHCGGTGGEIIDTQPIEADDLDDMCGGTQ